LAQFAAGYIRGFRTDPKASFMKRLLWLSCLAALAALPLPASAQTQHSQFDGMIASHAKENLVPEALVHRVIVRESKYQPSLVGRGGAIGLMQIKLATARSLGYSGTAEGLRDPETNLKYAVKYLAGAYRAAKGDFNRAVHYYAAGYYLVAKQQRLEHVKEVKNTVASAAPKPLLTEADAKAEGTKEETKPEDAKAEQADTEQADNSASIAAAPQEQALQEQDSSTSANAR
jgi:soluble lytic murein transglycosylase-like protein